MYNKSLVLSEEEIKRLKEMTDKYNQVTPPDYANYTVVDTDLRIIIYNSNSVVFIGKKAMKYYEEFLKYKKGKSYDEIGADETGKEVYGPMVAVAVYYDDEFNQDLFEEIEITDSKKLKGEKLKHTAEKLMDPKNKLKFTIVEAIGDYSNPERDYDVHRLDYDKIHKLELGTDNKHNHVQAVMLNEAIRLLIDEFGKPSYITYDRFLKDDNDKRYYEYLTELNDNSITDIIPNFKIVENIKATPAADEIKNSPSAAASIIAKYVRDEFFEYINRKYQVIGNDGKQIEMPQGDTEPTRSKEYARKFSEQYKLDDLKKVAKTSKEPLKSLMEELENLEKE